MRITLLTLFILAALTSATGTFKTENKGITKNYVFVKGSGEVKDFYISSTEISNQQYREFLNDLKAKGNAEKLKIAEIHSERWNNAAYTQHYFIDKEYNDYPVVNITKKAAQLYCDWLTEQYNARAKNKVHFVLPSEAQWMLAAKAGHPDAIYPWNGKSLKYEGSGQWKGENMCNYKVSDPVMPAKQNDKANLLAQVVSFLPNDYNIYNMAGNAAEIIADKNYTKGGSYNSPADKITIASYEESVADPGPRPTVGFRPILLVADTK